MNERYHLTCAKKIFNGIFGRQYLFEIYHTSFNIKNRENVVKSGSFRKLLQWRAYFFLNEGGV